MIINQYNQTHMNKVRLLFAKGESFSDGNKGESFSDDFDRFCLNFHAFPP